MKKSPMSNLPKMDEDVFARSLLSPFLSYNHDGYADLTFECPAITTCPIACVASVGDCPSGSNYTCPEGATLCLDGSCAPAGAICDSWIESPCEYDCAPVACAQITTYYDTCYEVFGDIYDEAASCAEEYEDSIPLIPADNAWFVFLYTWIIVITFAILLWCAFNQRLSPVPGSSKPLQEANSTTDEDEKDSSKPLQEAPSTTEGGEKGTDSSGWIQTAYRSNIVGGALYLATEATLMGFQVVLGVLTILYYQQQELVLTDWYPPVFQSESQVLIVFEIVWSIGFVWSLLLRWPETVLSLFLRRCLFEHATHVAVFAPHDEVELIDNSEPSTSCLQWFKNLIASSSRYGRSIMKRLFSDVSRPDIPGKIDYIPITIDRETGSRSFVFRLRRYNYDPDTDSFVPGVWMAGKFVGDFTSASGGLSEADVQVRRDAVGSNAIDMVKPNVFKSIYDEFQKPFYLYQTFIVWTWFPLWYYYMAVVYTVVRWVAGVVVGVLQYRNEATLYRLSHVSGDVEVLRDGEFKTLPQQDLVPGDVVTVRNGLTFVDMALIKGDHVLVDESALTGEVTPIVKMQLDPAEGEEEYESQQYHKKCTVSAGCTVLETSDCDRDLAVVTNTGSFTTKGELVRDILSYQRHRFKFDVEVQLVIAILLLWAIIAFLIVFFILRDQAVYGWFYGMYVFVSALPPLLPTVFVVSVGISGARLNKKRIACTNSQGILVSGKVKIALFDKTGTLTNQGLDFVSTKRFGASGDKDLRVAMMVCHGLTKSKTVGIVGNTVDKMMFEATEATIHQETGAHLQIVDTTGEKLTVLKRFDFDHHRMTQSVVVKDAAGNATAFVKGSAESIVALCDMLTVPGEVGQYSRESGRQGLYQIAVAKRELSDEVDLEKLTRDQLEDDFSFLGFVNFKNTLREETPDVLAELERGDIRTVMVTGDNTLTAIHIAKESGLVKKGTRILIADSLTDTNDVNWIESETEKPVTLETIRQVDAKNLELAITGPVWLSLLENNPDLARDLAERVRIYGRCTPIAKVAVIDTFNKEGFVTLMCGDGGNDCGALKSAHVGIALSDAEASIVAPFTSMDKTTASVVTVVREGRCALASALACYKYMLMYGMVATFIQIVCPYLGVEFDEWNWVFLDGVWVLIMAFTLPLARAAKYLAPYRPTSSLFGAHTMSSFMGVFLINTLFTIGALLALYGQDWFLCREFENTDFSNGTVLGDNYESSVLFLVAGYQVLASAAAYNFGYVHRAAWWRNWIFVSFFIGLSVIQFYITLVPSSLSCFFRINCSNDNIVRSLTDSEPQPINNAFNTTIMPVEFRWKIAAIMLSNLIAICIWEYFFVNGPLIRNYVEKRRIKSSRKRNSQLMKQSTKTISAIDSDDNESTYTC